MRLGASHLAVANRDRRSPGHAANPPAVHNRESDDRRRDAWRSCSPSSTPGEWSRWCSSSPASSWPVPSGSCSGGEDEWRASLSGAWRSRSMPYMPFLASFQIILFSCSCSSHGCVIAVPMIGGIGAAWVRLSTQAGAIPRRAGATAGLSVFGLTVLPFLMLLTFWPLRLAFLVARPSLDRLADQVAAGNSVGLPQQVGVFPVRLRGRRFRLGKCRPDNRSESERTDRVRSSSYRHQLVALSTRSSGRTWTSDWAGDGRTARTTDCIARDGRARRSLLLNRLASRSPRSIPVRRLKSVAEGHDVMEDAG